jgi:hypothetical protein
MATTLAQLRLRCQEESDNINQTFISDAEWLSYINASYQELYGLIVESFGNDYFVQSPAAGYTFVTDGTNSLFALPSAFFKLLGVDLQINTAGYWATLKPFAFSERNQLSLNNSSIPMAGQTVRVLYAPKATLLSGDADTVEGVNGWEELIIIDSCIKALAKEESDVSVFMARKAAFQQRLDSEIENRDASGATRVADSRGRSVRSMRYRLNGNNLWLIGNGQPGWGAYGDWDDDRANGWW